MLDSIEIATSEILGTIDKYLLKNYSKEKIQGLVAINSDTALKGGILNKETAKAINKLVELRYKAYLAEEQMKQAFYKNRKSLGYFKNKEVEVWQKYPNG